MMLILEITKDCSNQKAGGLSLSATLGTLLKTGTMGRVSLPLFSLSPHKYVLTNVLCM